MSYRVKKKDLLIFVIATAVVLYLVFDGNVYNTIVSFKHMNLSWLLMSVVGILLFWLFEAMTFHLIIKNYDPKFSFRKILKLTVATQFFNGITPFSSGGQPFQIYALTKNSKLGVSKISSAALHNFILYQTALVLMGIAALIANQAFGFFAGDSLNLRTLAFIGIALNITVIAALLVMALAPKLLTPVINGSFKLLQYTPLKKRLPRFKDKLQHWIETFRLDNAVLFKKNRYFFPIIVINILKLGSFYSIAYFVCRAVGFNELNIYQAIIASAFVMLITSLVPIPGATGGAEFGFLAFFGAFNIGTLSHGIMLLWRFITYYIGLLIGFITFYFGYCLNTKKTVSPKIKQSATSV